GRGGQRRRGGQPGGEGRPEVRRRGHRVQRRQRPERADVPADGLVQSRGQGLQPEVLARRQGADDHDRARPGRPGRLRPGAGHAKDAKGLLISGVKSGSPAEAAGLESGQLITRVVKDRKVQSVNSVKEFEALAGKAGELAVYVEGGDRPGRFVTLSKPQKD